MCAKKIYKSWYFIQQTKKLALDDNRLYKAVEEMERGLIDADLGGGVYKKRIPLSGRGKRGGARTIIATRFEGLWFFLYGFAKNERDNINDTELKALRKVAHDYLEVSAQGLRRLLDAGELEEVIYNERNSEGDA